jgi:hypothetical protein
MTEFEKELARRLSQISVTLLYCRLSQSTKGDLVWSITARMPDQALATVEADFPGELDGYSDAVLDGLSRRLITHFSSFWAC